MVLMLVSARPLELGDATAVGSSVIAFSSQKILNSLLLYNEGSSSERKNCGLPKGKII